MKKWNPGHYVTLPSNFDQTVFDAALNEAKTRPVQGFQIRYKWRDLEPAQDTYNLGLIANDLSRISAAGKRLVIFVVTKSFTPEPVVPGYLEPYTWAYNPDGGFNIMLWESFVQNRLAAMLRVLGGAFDGHLSVEAVCLQETAGVSSVTQAQLDGWFAGLRAVHASAAPAWPNTILCQFTNYPKASLPALIGSYPGNHVSLGGPDIFIEDPGLLNGAYPYYAQNSGILPLMPSVQYQNYVQTIYGQQTRKPTVQELFAFGRDNLKATHMFWTRAFPHWPNVLALFDSADVKDKPAGGLNPQYPLGF